MLCSTTLIFVDTRLSRYLYFVTVRNESEKVIHQRTNTVPFDLASHDMAMAATIRVIRPLDSSELDLETTYENFHPTVQSLTNVIGHFISGERPKGMVLLCGPVLLS